jgi:hypothetical protein
MGYIIGATEVSDLDDDGYPTEEALEKIKTWSYHDFLNLMIYIESLWYFPDYFNQGEILDDFNTRVIEYRLSTGGWSGNEDIIRALEANTQVQSCFWWSSRRGGHHVYRRPIK